MWESGRMKGRCHQWRNEGNITAGRAQASQLGRGYKLREEGGNLRFNWERNWQPLSWEKSPPWTSIANFQTHIEGVRGRLTGRWLRIHTCSSYCWPAQFLMRRQSLFQQENFFPELFLSTQKLQGWLGMKAILVFPSRGQNEVSFRASLHCSEPSYWLQA